MCGIAGLYSLNGARIEASMVAQMCDLLRHRGPDDDGLWDGSHVALGHRRLSIIDLSPRGRNPMANEDGTVWIVFNGEIYNYKALRQDLVTRGHRFRSATDTEVILHLYEEYGPDCVGILNGMFALALYDGRTGAAPAGGGRLLLARDRFGVKPLYYTQIGDTLAFASEIKAFLAVPRFSVRLDVYALAEHFAFQNTLGDRTFFENVKILPAGCFLVCEHGSVRTQRYWTLRYVPAAGRSLDAWARGLRERFEAAVSRQLMSDVPLGTYLSGGMDTGAISAVAARQISRMHTFTCGFVLPEGHSDLEQYFDERDESHRLSRHLETVHHELELGPDAMIPALPTVVWHLDEPRVGISYQVYYTAEMIRRFVTVVLSGVGGDELFAGYPWRYDPVVHLDRARFAERYYQLCCRLLSDQERTELFSDEMHAALGDFAPFDTFRTELNEVEAPDPLHLALGFDFRTFLHGLLIVDDKLSMAHSVEARVPFLDNDLVDYVAQMPPELKLSNGQGKVVLRKAMAGLLPDDVLARRKQGFTPPDRTWYKYYNWRYIEELLLGPRALGRGYFRPSALRRLLDDHLQDRRDHRFLIWSLMCFEWWNRLFMDRQPVSDAEVESGTVIEHS